VTADLTVPGSTGQPKAHPLIAASSDLRRVLDVRAGHLW
jgi:hypothetical protein